MLLSVPLYPPQVRPADVVQVAVRHPEGAPASQVEVHLRTVRGQKAQQWLHAEGAWQQLGACTSSAALPQHVTRSTPDRRNGVLTMPIATRKDWAERQAYTHDHELGSSAITAFQQTHAVGERGNGAGGCNAPAAARWGSSTPCHVLG